MSDNNPNMEGPLTHLSAELMEGFVKGTLSGEMREKVQAYLDANPFEAEAMEGVIAQKEMDLSSDMDDLQARLQEAVSPKVPRFTGWWRVAAAVALLSLSGVMLYYFMPDTPNEGLTLDHELVKEPEAPSPTESSIEQPAVSPQEGEERKSSNDSELEITEQSGPEIGSASLKELKSPVREPDAEAVDEPSEILADEDFSSEDRTRTAATIEPRSAPPQKVESQQNRDLSGLALSDSMTIPYEYKVVVGKVTSAASGNPLAGANIAVKGTDLSTVSDQNGFFHLEAPLEAESLVGNSIGFDSREVAIEDQPQIDVVLDENQSSLSEVVVTRAEKKSAQRMASGAAEAPVATQEADTYQSEAAVTGKATPPANYSHYLTGNTSYPAKARSLGIEGSVIVEFVVKSDGTLTNFQILKKLGFGCDEEAVKVLKNGPSWNPAQTQGKSVESPAQYEIKFPPDLN